MSSDCEGAVIHCWDQAERDLLLQWLILPYAAIIAPSPPQLYQSRNQTAVSQNKVRVTGQGPVQQKSRQIIK